MLEHSSANSLPPAGAVKTPCSKAWCPAHSKSPVHNPHLLPVTSTQTGTSKVFSLFFLTKMTTAPNQEGGREQKNLHPLALGYAFHYTSNTKTFLLLIIPPTPKCRKRHSTYLGMTQMPEEDVSIPNSMVRWVTLLLSEYQLDLSKCRSHWFPAKAAT